MIFTVFFKYSSTWPQGGVSNNIQKTNLEKWSNLAALADFAGFRSPPSGSFSYRGSYFRSRDGACSWMGGVAEFVRG